jgi:hypothetical protein
MYLHVHTYTTMNFKNRNNHRETLGLPSLGRKLEPAQTQYFSLKFEPIPKVWREIYSVGFRFNGLSMANQTIESMWGTEPSFA